MLPLALAEAPSAIMGLVQLLKGSSQLRDLHRQPVAQYGEDPEMAASRIRADQNSQYGFSPAEKAGFRKNIAEDINTQSQNALNLGGGQLGRVIAGQGKINEMKGEADFANRDAALHRQNIQYADKFSQQLQNLHNMNIAQQLKTRLMAEQSLGNAIKTGSENLVNAASGGLTLGIGEAKDNSDKKLGIGAYANGAAAGFNNNFLGKNLLGLSTNLGYQNPNESKYNAPPLIPNTQYKPPTDIGYDPANAISSNLDPNQYDFNNLYGGLGKFLSAGKFK